MIRWKALLILTIAGIGLGGCSGTQSGFSVDESDGKLNSMSTPIAEYEKVALVDQDYQNQQTQRVEVSLPSGEATVTIESNGRIVDQMECSPPERVRDIISQVLQNVRVETAAENIVCTAIMPEEYVEVQLPSGDMAMVRCERRFADADSAGLMRRLREAYLNHCPLIQAF